MKLIRSAPLTGGGTVTGDLTVEGDFVVEGGGSLTVDNAVTGVLSLTKQATTGAVPLDILQLKVSETTDVDTVAGEGPGIAFYVSETSGDELAGRISVVKESATDATADAAMTFWTSVDDTAPSEKMRIDSAGNVGIGTAAPAGLLDISSDGTTADYTALAFASGQLRLTNSTDPADDTKRYAAITFAQRDDEVARIVSKMNKNSSSADTYGDLRFLTKGDGDAALTERMTILEDGNVGIGAAAPTKPLCFGSSAVGHGMIDDFATTIYGALGLAHATAGGLKIEGYRDADGDGEGAVLIKGALGEAAVDTKTTGAGAIIFLQADIKSSNTTTTAGTDQNLMALRTGSTTRYIWDAEGSGHADVEWVAFSDSRLKTSIEDVPYGLAEVLQLQPKRYDKESGSFDDSGNVVLEGNKRKMIGFMAQDIKTIIPELVKDVDESKSFYSMDDGKLTAVLVKAIQELSAKVEALENA